MDSAEPFRTLLDLTTGQVPARCLYVDAELGIADAIDESPKPAEVADQVGATTTPISLIEGQAA